jgi:hypothetical protein
MVEGNPLEDVANAHKVRRVVFNGRVYELEAAQGRRARIRTLALSSSRDCGLVRFIAGW